MRKPGILDRSDVNRAAQSQNLLTGLNFWTWELRDCAYVAYTNALISYTVTAYSKTGFLFPC